MKAFLPLLTASILGLCASAPAYAQTGRAEAESREREARAAADKAAAAAEEAKREAVAEAEAVAEDSVDEPESAPDPISAPTPMPPRTGAATTPSPEAEAPEETPSPPSPPADPQIIKLDLMDGSTISGKLSVKEITIDTRFGSLKVPVEFIRSITPGLDSYPSLGKEVQDLIEKLGSEDYNARENARKALTKMGPGVEGELKARLQDGNAERVRHLKAILQEFEQLSIAEEEEEDAVPKAWNRQDTIETVDFTVTGKISPKDFVVTTNFGPLNIKLADIRRAQRTTSAREELRKALTVEGTNLVALSFKPSGLRVEKGDQVTVSADGTIVMSPWGGGAVSTPDGGANYGWYVPNQIYSGCLVAKIGDNGPVFKVGSKNNFKADRSGQLQFAIAMQHDYGQGNYQFPGKYDLKIKVQPQ